MTSYEILNNWIFPLHSILNMSNYVISRYMIYFQISLFYLYESEITDFFLSFLLYNLYIESFLFYFIYSIFLLYTIYFLTFYFTIQIQINQIKIFYYYFSSVIKSWYVSSRRSERHRVLSIGLGFKSTPSEVSRWIIPHASSSLRAKAKSSADLVQFPLGDFIAVRGISFHRFTGAQRLSRNILLP